MGYIKSPVSKNDSLIGAVYRCSCNGKSASVTNRGTNEFAGKEIPIVFLDNGEVWDLVGFFNNWVPQKSDQLAVGADPTSAANQATTAAVSSTQQANGADAE